MWRKKTEQDVQQLRNSWERRRQTRMEEEQKKCDAGEKVINF